MAQLREPSDQMIRVLLVDDEVRLTELLRLELDVEGYEFVTTNCASRSDSCHKGTQKGSGCYDEHETKYGSAHAIGW